MLTNTLCLCGFDQSSRHLWWFSVFPASVSLLQQPSAVSGRDLLTVFFVIQGCLGDYSSLSAMGYPDSYPLGAPALVGVSHTGVCYPGILISSTADEDASSSNSFPQAASVDTFPAIKTNGEPYPVSSSKVYGAEQEGHHNQWRIHLTWVCTCIPMALKIPGEPSSSFPEDDPVAVPLKDTCTASRIDLLPAVKDVQISGEPHPGKELQACGYPINGTTTCHFKWIRVLEDGSVKGIDGATKPTYLVTADDVETYLVVEVEPLDDRKRKGEMVRVSANDCKKIICDPTMHAHIVRNFHNGRALYQVSVSTGYLDIWESATLVIKREGYSIKGSGSSGVNFSEKFLPGTTVTITHGEDFEFAISNPGGSKHILRAEGGIKDIPSGRDAIVLTLRLFIKKAMQKGKKKWSWMFFK